MLSLLLSDELTACFQRNLETGLTEPLVSLLQSAHCTLTGSISEYLIAEIEITWAETVIPKTK